MRDVIQKLIETEAEAKRIVEAAKADAAQILSDAHKKGQDLRALRHQETRIETERILDVATREAEQEKQARLARAAAEIETQIRLDEATKQRAVEAGVRCVCGFGLAVTAQDSANPCEANTCCINAKNGGGHASVVNRHSG